MVQLSQVTLAPAGMVNVWLAPFFFMTGVRLMRLADAAVTMPVTCVGLPALATPFLVMPILGMVILPVILVLGAAKAVPNRLIASRPVPSFVPNFFINVSPCCHDTAWGCV